MAKQKQPTGAGEESKDTFTTQDKGSTVLMFQKPESERHVKTGDIITTKRAIMVRLQRGVEFDSFKECGPNGRQKLFREVDPQLMHEFLMEKVADRENKICFWKDRPMSEEERALEDKLRTRDRHISEQKRQNEALKELILNSGLKLPDGL